MGTSHYVVEVIWILKEKVGSETFCRRFIRFKEKAVFLVCHWKSFHEGWLLKEIDQLFCAPLCALNMPHYIEYENRPILLLTRHNSPIMGHNDYSNHHLVTCLIDSPHLCGHRDLWLSHQCILIMLTSNTTTKHELCIKEQVFALLDATADVLYVLLLLCNDNVIFVLALFLSGTQASRLLSGSRMTF